MKQTWWPLLKSLSELNGISGFENQVAAYIEKVIKPFVDEIQYDGLGSLLAIKKGKNPNLTVMLAAHMDEVGFVVSQIEESGMLRLAPVGGWWGHVLLAQVMTITTREGKTFQGVIGARPPHGMSAEARNRVLEIKEMYVDLGLSSRKEVEAKGIRIGDMVNPKTEAMVMNDSDIVMGKAWDDRVSCGVLIELMRRLKDVPTEATIIAAFTVQEEIGLRGAKTSTYKAKPDLGFAIDVTMSHDLPGGPKLETRLGQGVALSILDASVIAHRGLVEDVERVAKTNQIPFTYDVMPVGGTDAGEMHKAFAGVVTMTLSIPCRYYHSHTSMVHLKDVEMTTQLLDQYLRQFNQTSLSALHASKFKA
ncbi:MAG: M42 family metallopeptidase [Bacilli bacterium]